MTDMEIFADFEVGIDFLRLTKEDFLNKYSFFDSAKYHKIYKEFYKNIELNLAYLMRRAENVRIENLNGRETGFTLTGDQFKDVIDSYAYRHLPPGAYADYADYCDNLGC